MLYCIMKTNSIKPSWEKSCEGFSYAQSEVKECQENLNDRVLIQVVHALLTEGFVRNTNSKRTNATRSMTETLLYAVGTEECGKE